MIWCMKCKKKVETQHDPDMHIDITTGRQSLRGRCVECGGTVYKFIKKYEWEESKIDSETEPTGGADV